MFQFAVGQKCSVYGWGTTRKGGPHRFTVQHVEIKTQICCEYWHSLGSFGILPDKDFTEEFICAGIFGFTLCPVRKIQKLFTLKDFRIFWSFNHTSLPFRSLFVIMKWNIQL